MYFLLKNFQAAVVLHMVRLVKISTKSTDLKEQLQDDNTDNLA